MTFQKKKRKKKALKKGRRGLPLLLSLSRKRPRVSLGGQDPKGEADLSLRKSEQR